MIVTFSRLRAWRRCPRLYYYKYTMGLTTRRPKLPLVRGSMIHDLIDATAKGSSPEDVMADYRARFQRYVDADPDYYGKLFDDCWEIFSRYLAHYQGDGNTWEASEVEVRVPLTDTMTFRGHIDKILKDERGNYWLLDHKTHKVFPDEAARFSDLQLLLYSWAWAQGDNVPLAGIVWDYIRTKPPAIPEALKRGGLSKRANIDTTADVYLEAIYDAGEDPADYQDILEKLEAKGNRFFKRVWLPHPPESMVNQILEDVIEVGGQMGTSKTRSLSKECGMCDFYHLCHAELRGHDVDYLIESEYTRRTDADFQLDEEEESSTDND